MKNKEYIKFSVHNFLKLGENYEIFSVESVSKVENEGFTKKIYLNTQDFNKLVDKLNVYHIQDWNEEYVNSNILDGESWSLEYNIKGNKKTIMGSNAYPPNWTDVKKVIEFLDAEINAFGKVSEE